MKELNLEIKEVNVEPCVIKTDVTVKMGTPIFAMHKSCWKELGINNIFQYWMWQRKMKKLWKKKS